MPPFPAAVGRPRRAGSSRTAESTRTLRSLRPRRGPRLSAEGPAAGPVHLGQHRDAARRHPDLPQHRCEHPVDRRVPRADRRAIARSLTLPLYYCYGRSVLQTHLFVGGSVVLDNRFAFPRIGHGGAGAEGCTGFAGVPLTFELIRRQVDVATIAFPSLRYVTQAGGAMAPETIAWARAAFPPAELFVMYGQTEATARLSYLPPDRAEDKAGSIGIAIPGVELQVVDDARAGQLPTARSASSWRAATT